MDKELRNSLIWRGIVLGVVLLFWVPMLYFYRGYVNTMTDMDEEAEEVAEGYFQAMLREFTITRIVLAVGAVALFVFLIVSVCRAFHKKRSKRRP
ncbi:MAG: hypothetical protein II943_05630 [Victivallales bacterium]|nr:hypothetical protein [Victivallales bacterium]